MEGVKSSEAMGTPSITMGEPRKPATLCTKCKGRGEIHGVGETVHFSNLRASMQRSITCYRCNGTGLEPQIGD